MDVPQDIRGIDVGPSPTPYERAEQLAAEAYGARARGSSRTARRRATTRCASRSRRSARPVVAQRNSHASVVDGLVLSGGVPTFVAPEYDPERGMAHGVTPRVAGGGARAHARRARRVHRLADLLRDVRRRRRLRAGRARRRRRRSSSTSRGARTSGSTTALPASALQLGADAVLTSTHKLGGSLTQSAILHLGHGDRIDAARVARAVRIVRSTSPSSLLLASLDAARRQLAVHGEQLLHETLAGDRRRAREAARGRGRRAARPGARRTARDRRLRPAAHRPRHARHRLHGHGARRRRCATTTTCTPSSRRSRRSSSSSGSGSAPRRCCGSPATSTRRSGGCAARDARRSRSTSRTSRPSSASRRATPSSATPSASPSTTPSGGSRASRSPATRRASRRCCPGERITSEIVRYLRETVAAGGRLHGASDPAFEHGVRAARGLTAAQRTRSTGLPTAPPSAKPASSRAPVLERRALADDRAQLPLGPPAPSGRRARPPRTPGRAAASRRSSRRRRRCCAAAAGSPPASGSSRSRTRSTRMRPSGAVQRRLWSKRSPPTGSTTRSAPRPPVAARTSATQSSAGSSAMSAPACVATRRRSSSEPSAITMPAPAALRDLDRRGPDAAGGAVDEHGLAGLDPPARARAPGAPSGS